MTSATVAQRWATFQQTAAEVDAKARTLRPGLVLLTLAIAVPFIVGWVARKAVIVVWWLVSRLWTAVMVGWDAGSPKRSEAGSG